ncbi:MAG: hypothetical protein LBK99_09365 [Opitutaceae bacterium]|jgi:hypothetical protein|nr:hypothetical protein [Opitutaceae bacterium]
MTAGTRHGAVLQGGRLAFSGWCAGVMAGVSGSVVIDGEGTLVAGRFFDGGSTTSLTVSNGATWTSTGASIADNLTFGGNANVLLTLDSLTDTITANDTLTLTGTNNVTIGLTNQALQEIVNGSDNGTYDLDATALIKGSTLDNSEGTGSLEYTMLDHNDTGSTWTVIGSDDGHFTISGISITISAVPEPAAWAALAGVVLLVCAAMSRRRA